jgi:hypothetical protein
LVPFCMTRFFSPRNTITHQRDEKAGCYFSRQPFSKSYPYFEVELVELQGDLDQIDKESELEKSGVVFGCLHEQSFIIRNPMDSKIDKGGEVQVYVYSHCLLIYMITSKLM